MICPSHGPILRENLDAYMNFYKEQAKGRNLRKENNQAVIVYASAYGNTKKLAEKIHEGISDSGVKVKVFDASNCNMEDLINEIEASNGLLIGTATINSKAPKPIFDVFSSMVVLNVAGRIAGVFGSYGWSGEGIVICEDILRTMRMKTPLESFKVKMTPSEKELNDACEWGREFGIALLGSS